MTGNIIACRPECYDLPLREAVEQIKCAGIENVEVRVPRDMAYDEAARICADVGVTITTLATGGALDVPEDLAALERTIAGAAAIGIPIIFLAASMREGSYEDGLPLLKTLARQAHEVGVILSIETHVPFAHNGDRARATMEAVGVPGIGYNFDTANIYYYNPKGTDGVAELRKALPFVTSVHLKESGHGEPEAFDFPVLGEGIVDFPEVFRLLGGRGFVGPYTLELEGPLMNGRPAEERTELVRQCLAYLKAIGVA